MSTPEPEVEFIRVDPGIARTGRKTTQWRISQQVCENFLLSGLETAELDLSEAESTTQSVLMSLRGYIQRHHLPMKVFVRQGNIRFRKVHSAEWTPSEPIGMKEVKDDNDRRSL